MQYVNQMNIRADMSLEDLMDEMEKVRVLGAGKLSKATRIVSEIFEDEEYTVFLAIAGPMVPGGLRSLIRYLIAEKFVNGIVSTGANVTHDLIESIGFRHKVGNSRVDDLTLKKRNLGRIYDIYVEQRAFEELEKEVYRILENIPEERRKGISSYDLLREIGGRIGDRNSILKTAQIENVPIICPCLHDSMVGLHLWTFSQLKTLSLNPLLDMNKLSDMMFTAKKVGVIILGGGVPKHHILVASTFRDGVDAAVQITLDRPEGGGLSGAPLEEAISWRKIRSNKRIVTVTGDVTMLFPIIVLSAIQSINKKRD